MTVKMVISSPKVVTGHSNCLIMKEMMLEGLSVLVEISCYFEIVTNVEILSHLHHCGDCTGPGNFHLKKILLEEYSSRDGEDIKTKVIFKDEVRAKNLQWQ